MELHDLVIDHAALDEHQRRFDELGYTILKGALPPAKVQELLAVIEGMRAEFDAHEHRNASERGLNIRPVVDKHPAFRALLMSPAAFPVVVKLLGHYNIQLMQSHLYEADAGHAQRVTGWHNDGGIPAIEVNGIRAFGSLKVGYFLRAISDENMGGLMVVPGSHRIQGAPPFADGEADPVGAIQVRFEAGDAIVFQQGLWHAAAPNLSNQRRTALYYGYGYRVFRPVDYQTMPAKLLEACSPIERQLLGETVNHQGYYLPTVEDTPLKPWFDEHFEPVNRGNLGLIRQ